METGFTWRTEKAIRNLAKHGVSFEAAKEVFFDPNMLIIEDREVDGEIRYHAIGYSQSEVLLLVVHIDRSDEDREIIHIISARKADKYEQRTYADQFA
jgi:hypothetical protein